MVNVIWSLSNGGSSITSTINHGNVSNGQKTSVQTIYIRHDGSSQITDVGFYIRQFSGTYSGQRTPVSDINEILSWGNQTLESAFGGFQINMNAVDGFPLSSWSLYNSKEPDSGKGNVFRSGIGDSEGNAIELKSSSGSVADSTIQSGNAPNVRFQIRIEVPSDETDLGIRQFDQIVRYNFTS